MSADGIPSSKSAPSLPPVGALAPSRYEILRPLATGGMGEIFLARMRGVGGFERLVVIKRLLPEIAKQAELVTMFLDEMRLLASVQHSNVVHIYDVGTTPEGAYFYAMEFLHGQDLRTVARRCRDTGMPLGASLSVCMAALSGLHYVHERRGADGKPLKIVHRDVSPGNIFVTYDGQVKLLDFGIAKSADGNSKTSAGVLKGKFAYMSPEQARALPVDRRTDIFAMGVVLWEITTGQRLFKGENYVETLLGLVEKGATPPSAVKPEYPSSLEQVVMKALEREQASRYQTAIEFQQALEGVAREQSVSLASGTLADFMGKLFEPEISAWQAAQEQGKDLAQHVAESWRDSGSFSGSGSGTPVSISARVAPRMEQTVSSVIDISEARPKRRPLALASLAVAVPLLAGALWWLLSTPAPVPARPVAPAVALAPALPATPPPPPPAPAPAPVRLVTPPFPEAGTPPTQLKPASPASKPLKARPVRPPSGEPLPGKDSSQPSPRWEPDSPLPPT